MNILYVCNTDPRETFGGMRQRSNYLYRALLKLGEVYVVATDGYDDALDGRIFKTNFKGSRSWFARHINGLWYRLVGRRLGLPWVMTVWPAPLHLDIENAFPSVKFDIVVARYLPSAAWSFAWRFGSRLIVDMDDDPCQVYDTMVASSLPVLKRIVGWMVVRLSILYIGWHIDGVWYSNSEQIRNFPYRKPCIALENLPPKIEDGYRPDSQRELAIMTVAAMGYLPNPRGIDNFISNCWGELRKKFPGIKYWLVGEGLPEDFRKRWEMVQGVEIMGRVDDLGAIYQKSLAAVVPIYQGGGTCIKTLDAMKHSRVCFSSLFGARGIPKRDLVDGQKGIFIFNNVKDIIVVLEKLINDEHFRSNREMAAKDYVDKHYSFAKFANSVRALIRSVV